MPCAAIRGSALSSVAGVCHRSCKTTTAPARTRHARYAALTKRVMGAGSKGKQLQITVVYPWSWAVFSMCLLHMAEAGRNHRFGRSCQATLPPASSASKESQWRNAWSKSLLVMAIAGLSNCRWFASSWPSAAALCSSSRLCRCALGSMPPSSSRRSAKPDMTNSVARTLCFARTSKISSNDVGLSSNGRSSIVSAAIGNWVGIRQTTSGAIRSMGPSMKSGCRYTIASSCSKTSRRTASSTKVWLRKMRKSTAAVEETTTAVEASAVGDLAIAWTTPLVVFIAE
mmetsp:Transcript_69399/g.224411  ORF Transcript_69399/g.224411 Transcript_69399/m.224411 type:complete len:285 (-) Transcript_69399:22-876(-)